MVQLKFISKKESLLNLIFPGSDFSELILSATEMTHNGQHSPQLVAGGH